MTDTREQWLNRATLKLRALFTQHGHTVPDNVKTTCGFPSRGALSARKRTIGQCWDSKASKGKVFEIFISPTIAKPLDVLATLAHELVHATVGLKAGHKTPFKRCAHSIGLEGRMTATEPGEAFIAFANGVLPKLGDYPHTVLNAMNQLKKQGTRLLKCACPECGYTVRITRVWLDGAGAPNCPSCEVELQS